MNKILVVLVVLVILGVAFVFLRPQKAPVSEALPAPQDAGAVENGRYEVREGSTITWQGRRPLIQGYMDSGSLTVSSGVVTVADESVVGDFTFDMTTIKALNTGRGDGEDKLTGHLKSPDFFDVETYPESRLSITGVTKGNGEHEYTAEGTLTMKGITNPISFPITAYSDPSGLHLTGTISVDRTLWGVEYGSGKFFQDLADKVIDDFFTVGVDLTLVKQ